VPKPLHEMDMSETLRLLTPSQVDAVQSYARRLARSNLTVSQHGENPQADPDRKSRGLDSAEGRGQSQGKSRKSVLAGTNWCIDGRGKRPAQLEASSAGPSKRTTYSGRLVKCGMCGHRIAEADFERHWTKAHRNSRSKEDKMKEASEMNRRLVQGGLCNPR